MTMTMRTPSVDSNNDQRESDFVVLSKTFQPGEYDVVCGRGKGSYARPGNRRFRSIVHDHVDEYIKAKTQLDKSLLLVRIVEIVESQDGGRAKFVNKATSASNHHSNKNNESGDEWIQICSERAREKVGHAMREAVNIRRSKQKLIAANAAAAAAAATARVTTMTNKNNKSTAQTVPPSVVAVAGVNMEEGSKPSALLAVQRQLFQRMLDEESLLSSSSSSSAASSTTDEEGESSWEDEVASNHSCEQGSTKATRKRESRIQQQQDSLQHVMQLIKVPPRRPSDSSIKSLSSTSTSSTSSSSLSSASTVLASGGEQNKPSFGKPRSNRRTSSTSTASSSGASGVPQGISCRAPATDAKQRALLAQQRSFFLTMLEGR